MITLYVDRFRGFQNATIPLASANFFVGENSTGKSSLLTALADRLGSHVLRKKAGE